VAGWPRCARAAAAARSAGSDVVQAVTQARRRATGDDVLVKESVPVIRRTLISAPVRDTLMVFVLGDLPSQKDIAAGFAEQGLPDPVPEDGRVHKSQKVKLVSRYFDAIDRTDAGQVDAVLTVCTQALSARRNRYRHLHMGELTTDMMFRRCAGSCTGGTWRSSAGRPAPPAVRWRCWPRRPPTICSTAWPLLRRSTT
jgi:hypothetical protein